MQYSQEHLKTMVYAKFGGQTECIMGNSKIENELRRLPRPCQFCTVYLPLPKFWSQFEPIFVFISLLLLL